MLTVEQARERRVCRLCEQPILTSGPQGWTHEFGQMVHPVRVTLLFGEEFAHTECLKMQKEAAAATAATATQHFVYIAGPLTRGDVMANIRNAIAAADLVLTSGAVPFLPHLSFFWNLISCRDYETWLAFDLAWLAKCDALIRLSGDSPGADREVAEAERLGIPVFHGVDAFLEAMAKEVRDDSTR